MARKNNLEKLTNHEDFFVKIKTAGNVPKALVFHQHRIVGSQDFRMINPRCSNVIGFAAGVIALELVAVLNPEANVYIDNFTSFRWIQDGRAKSDDALITSNEEALAFLADIERRLARLSNRSSIKHWVGTEV